MSHVRSPWCAERSGNVKRSGVKVIAEGGSQDLSRPPQRSLRTVGAIQLPHSLVKAGLLCPLFLL